MMAEERNYLQKYYNGITRKLKIEIEFLNGIIGHAGERGEANEVLLTNLLIKFLPKKYSIGSGIVIDRHGHASNQVDIIVYDSYFHPELFSQISTVLFPVDVVYMTIEVKTLLNKQKMKEAIENIQSVKRLEFIPSIILEELPEQPEDTLASFNRSRTSAPLGVIFGFRSQTKNYDTFESWINEPAVPPAEIFDLCYAMDSTFFYTFQDSDDKNAATTGMYLDTELSNSELNSTVSFAGTERVTDQAGGFLNFLTNVYDLLSLKSVIRRGILRDYLENNMSVISFNKNYSP